MLNVTMFYDIENKRWVEVKGKDYHDLDMYKLPVVLVLDYSMTVERRCLVAWCDEHKCFEEVASSTVDSVKTKKGCTLKGVIAFGKGMTEPAIYNIPIRWRYSQSQLNGRFSFSHDYAEIIFTTQRWIKFGEYYFYRPVVKYHMSGLSVDLHEGTWKTLSPLDDYKLDVPLEFYNEMLRRMIDNVEAVFKVRPVVRCEDGKYFDRILCFIKRPFDMGVAFNHYYLGDWFDRKFPRKQLDNYKTLCRIFAIYPSEKLESAYRRDPFAIHKLWAMRFIGFKDDNLIRILSSNRNLWNVEYAYEYSEEYKDVFEWDSRFHGTAEFAGDILEIDEPQIDEPKEYASNVSDLADVKDYRESTTRRWQLGNDEDVDADRYITLDFSNTRWLSGKDSNRERRVRLTLNDRFKLKRHRFTAENPYPADDVRHRFVAVNFAYCRDMKALFEIFTKLKTEYDLAEMLLNGMGKGFTSWQEDFFRVIREYRPHITGRGYYLLFNEGFTIDAYQAMARDIVDNVLKNCFEYHRLKQDKKFLDMERNVGGYDFRLIKYEEEFTDLSHHAKFNMANYKNCSIDEKGVTFLIEKDTEFCGLIEIRENRISHVEGLKSYYLCDELVKICCYWARLHDIDVRIGKLVIDGSQDYKETYEVKPLSNNLSIAERYSVNYLLNLPQDKIYEGYYRDLGIALEDYSERLPYFAAERDEFPNEYQYFNHRAPFANRIFDGAVSDKPDAQNEMGVLYEDGRFLTRDIDMAMSWYQKAVERGDNNAMANLAHCYIYDKKKFDTGLEWYEKAAEAGSEYAAEWLYEYKEAVKRGNVQAIQNKIMLGKDIYLDGFQRK